MDGAGAIGDVVSMIVLLLAACGTEPSDTATVGDSGAADTGDAAIDTSDTSDTSDTFDSGDTADSGDSGDTAPLEISPGPDCVSGDTYPVATPLNVLVGHVVRGEASDAEIADLRVIADDWAPSQQGPWVHEVRGPLTSSDGLAFAGAREVAINAASVAEITRLADGTYVALYVDGDLDLAVRMAEAHEPMAAGMIGLGGLGVSTSPDGRAWTAAALSFAGPVPAYVVDPEVLALADGRYALYFLGVEAEDLCADDADPFKVPGPHHLYRAESADLRSWSAPVEAWQNPIGGTDPAVWCLDGTTCYGWFSAPMASTDGGLTFASTGALVLVGAPQIPDVVQLEDGTWRMYSLAASGIEVASSADGRTFSGAAASGAGAGSPSAVVHGGTVELWVSGGD